MPETAAPPAGPPQTTAAPPNATVPDSGKLPSGPLDAQSREAFAGAFESLEKLGRDDGAPESGDNGTPTPSPEKPEPKADLERDDKGKFLPKKDAPKPEVKPEAKKPETKPQPKAPEQPEHNLEKMAPKQLREAYENLRKKHEAIEREYGEFKTKASEPKDDPEKKVLSEKVSDYEKRLATLDEELRYTAYERSQEFKDKYEKPYVDAWMQGRANMETIDVLERKNDETGEVMQQARAAKAEDFDALMQLDDRSFRKQVNQLFGSEQAAEIIADRKRVKELLNAKTNALKQFRDEGAEREQKRLKAQEEGTRQIRETWTQANKTAVEKYPQWFAPDDADPKGNELLERGFHMADRAFSNGQPLRDGDKPLSPIELTKLQSALRNKAAGFDRLAHKYETLKKAHDELAAKLKGYEDSEPGPGDGKRVAAGEEEVASGDYMGAFDKKWGR